MSIGKNTFKYVDYLWDKKKAKELGDDQVELFYIDPIFWVPI